MVYHFDYRHNGALIRDDEGTALVSLDQARKEAIRALVEFAKDEVQAWDRRPDTPQDFIARR